MAAKSAEQVAQGALDKLGADMCWQATVVVSALRSSGWLREYVNAPDLLPSMTHQRDNLLSEVARLTRERDEAQKMRDYHEGRQKVAESSVATLSNALDYVRRERDEARGALSGSRAKVEVRDRQLAEARATQSSPEVLAAAKALREEAWYYRGNGVINKCIETFDAALAAVERKAEPKPRYYTDSGNVMERISDTGAHLYSTHYGHDRRERAEAECDKLNAADAAGRKS